MPCRPQGWPLGLWHVIWLEDAHRLQRTNSTVSPSGDFQKWFGTPKSSIDGFPWNEPSINWDTPIDGNLHIWVGYISILTALIPSGLAGWKLSHLLFSRPGVVHTYPRRVGQGWFSVSWIETHVLSSLIQIEQELDVKVLGMGLNGVEHGHMMTYIIIYIYMETPSICKTTNVQLAPFWRCVASFHQICFFSVYVCYRILLYYIFYIHTLHTRITYTYIIHV